MMKKTTKSVYEWKDICEWTGIPYRDHGTYQVECPYCLRQDKKHRMYVNADERIFNCFHCSNHGGAVDLFAMVNSVSFSQAKEMLKNIAKGKEEPAYLKVVSTRLMEEPVKSYPTARLASLDQRDKVYRAMLNLLKLNFSDRSYLRKKGLVDAAINALHFKSLPTNSQERNRMVEELQKQGLDLLGVPGFYEKDGQIKFVPFEYGILIPIVSPDKKVEGFQIRSTRKDTAKDKRYFALSSGSKNMGVKSETWIHCCVPNKDIRAVYLTEGALKADIAACVSGIPFVAVLGVNCLKHLKRTLSQFKNLKKVFVAYDMDKFDNPNVMQAQDNLVKLLTEAGYKVHIVNWDRTYKGIDDYLVGKKK